MEELRIQGERDHAGNYKQEDGKNFQESGKDCTGLGVAFVLCREHALDDDLVGAPIPDADDRRAKENSSPRKIGIGDGLHHVEVAGRDGSAEGAEASNFVETDESERDCAGEKNQCLDEIGVDDGSEAAGDRVNARRDDEDDCGGPLIPADDALEDDGRGIQMDGNFREDVRDDRDAREIRCAIAIEATLEKFGHGEDVGTQIEGNEDPAEEQKNAGSLPLEISAGESGCRARTGEADEMLRGNIGDEKRRADREPADVAPCEEVIFGGALFARKIKTDAEDQNEINGDDCQIDRRERPVRDCDSRCEEHRASVKSA